MQEIRDKGSIPGSGKSPWGRHGNPLQNLYLENPMDRGAWQVTVYVTKSWTWLKWPSTPVLNMLIPGPCLRLGRGLGTWTFHKLHRSLAVKLGLTPSLCSSEQAFSYSCTRGSRATGSEHLFCSALSPLEMPSPSVSSVQSLSHVRFFVTIWTAACQASLSITNSRSLPKLMSIELVMPSSHLILCHPLLLSPSIFPSIRVFSNESVLPIRWPKYWSFSFNISLSNECSGQIYFRMDWLDLLVVQGTLKGLIQHHSSKALILQHSAFFIVQRSHPYMIIGKDHCFD